MGIGMTPDLRFKLPKTHYVDNAIYVNEDLLAKEREHIFAKVWNFVCFESQLKQAGDYVVKEVAGYSMIIVRDRSNQLRAFHNVCRHRSVELVNNCSGNCANFTCVYHQWNYDLDGKLTGIPYPAAYEPAELHKEDFGLYEARVDTVCGLVFVCLSEETESLREYLGEVLDLIEEPLGTMSLDIIDHTVMDIKANWKLRTDNTRDFYHILLHAFNRKAHKGMQGDTPYRWTMFRNGHSILSAPQNVNIGSAIDYQAGGADKQRDKNLFPGMRPNEWILAAIYPNLAINIRSTVCRLDVIVPETPGLSKFDSYGLGLSGDSSEVRENRISDYNFLWGPMGFNWPEDVVVWESAWRNMNRGKERWGIFAREQDMAPFDDVPARWFYREWEKYMGMLSAEPYRPID